MKKGLSLLVAFALVFSLFSSVAFAATTPSEAGQKLKSLGIIKGDQNGDLMLDENWKRQDVAVLLARLLGQEDEAYNWPKTHTYADVRSDNSRADGTGYYDGFLSWARENGYMIGHSDTEFGFDDPITVKEFLTVILRALGYDPDFSSGEVEKLAVELGLVEEGTDFSAVATRGDTFVIIVTALDTEVAGTGQKLGTVLGLPGYEVTDPAVTGVTALNLKQVKVTFNKPVDKAYAETTSAYKVYNSDENDDLVTSDGKVELQSDNTSVIITLGEKLANGQSDAKIVVEGVKDVDGKTVPKFEGTFAVQDNTVPTVVGVKVVGPRDIEVEFSEPMENFAEEDFSVDDGAYFVVDVSDDVSSKVTVTTGLDMSEGEHKIRIDSKNGQDLAGYKPVPVTITFTVVKDTTPPVAEVLSVSPTQVKIGFNKPVDNVKNSNVLFRHTYNNGTYEGNGAEEYDHDRDPATPDIPRVTSNSSSTEFTVTFRDMPMALGKNRLYITYADDKNGPFITDRWGNKFEETSLEFEVTMDTTKPTVKEVKVEDAETIRIIFSEAVDPESVKNTENYVVKDSTGSEIEVVEAEVDEDHDNEVLLKFEEEALGGGTYTIEISGITDTALIPNAMDPYSATITANDTVRPYVLEAAWTTIDTKGTASKTDDDLRIYIPFSEQMKASTLVKSNFAKWDPTAGPSGKFVALDKNDTISVAGDAKSVTITLKGYGEPGPNDAVIQIGGNVTDLAGNPLRWLSVVGVNNDGLTDSKDNPQFAVKQDLIAPKEAKAISKNRIEVTFDGRLNSVVASEFEVYTDVSGDTYNVRVVAHSINKDGKSVVTFELQGEKMETDAKIDGEKLGIAVINNERTKSFLGTPITAGVEVEIADGIAPEIYKVEFKAADTIELTFTEPLKEDSIAKSGLNGFSVSSGELKELDIDAANGKITLKGDKFKKGSTVSYNGNADITDEAGNKLKAFSKKAE